MSDTCKHGLHGCHVCANAVLTRRAEEAERALRQEADECAHARGLYLSSQEALRQAQDAYDEAGYEAYHCAEERDAARFIRAGWRRLAEDKRTDARGWMLAHGEAARDRDAARAECERMRGVVEAARALEIGADIAGATPAAPFDIVLDAPKDIERLRAALAEYDAKGCE